jgi:hypothetical protein
MTSKDISKYLESQGTKINKDRLMDQVRRSTDKDFVFVNDETGKFVIVRVKVS